MIATKLFALAGDATFTVTSKATGTRFTYKVEKKEEFNRHLVKVLTGPDNWANYKYFGVIRPDGSFAFANPEKAKVSADAPSAKAFAFLWRHVDGQPFILKSTGETVTLPEVVDVHHEGKCCRCGRKLTVPESIESGIGPECAKLMGL